MGEIETLQKQVEELSGRLRGIEIGLPLLAITLAARSGADMVAVAEGFKALRGSLHAFEGFEVGSETPEAQALDRIVEMLESSAQDIAEIRAERS